MENSDEVFKNKLHQQLDAKAIDSGGLCRIQEPSALQKVTSGKS